MKKVSQHIVLLKQYGFLIAGTFFVLFLLVTYAVDRAHERALCVRGTHLLFFENPMVVTMLETPEERTNGLSGREVLPLDEGVVFAFGTAGSRNFWMKGMKFPIDVIFFDAEWNVIGLFDNLQPESYPHTYGSPKETYYALEATAGLINREEIVNGKQLRLMECSAIHP